MRIYVNLKQLKKRRNRIEPVPMELEGTPRTVRELIEAMVRLMAADYNRRVKLTKSDTVPRAFNEEEMDAMAKFGKLAFGFVYGKEAVDIDRSVETAVTAYEDGIVRIFLAQQQLGEIDDAIHINEGDTLTLLRLTMLAGRMW